MSKRISKFTSYLKQLGEIQVTEWDFIGLLNTNIEEFEFTRSLRKLGNLQVMDWDFRSVMPAVNRLAHQELDLVDLVRRTARYKVMDWDFRRALSTGMKPAPQRPAEPLKRYPSQAEMPAPVVRLKNFLQYVVVSLIDEPGRARIRIQEIESNVWRFKLVLVKRDVTMLIGRQGHTAAAIRGSLKAAARMHGLHALLQIQSHEEDMMSAAFRKPDEMGRNMFNAEALEIDG